MLVFVVVLLQVVAVVSVFFFKQKTAYEMRISDWSSDVCSSDLWKSPKRVLSSPWRDAPQARWRQLREQALRASGFQRPGQQLPALRAGPLLEIGSASCRERVGQYV